MAQPTAYDPSIDFSDEELSGVAGRSTVRTAALDAEHDAISVSINQLIANLSALQRDDLELIDGAVELHTLSAEVLLLLGSTGFTVNDPIAWVTAKEYAALSLVKEGTGTYVCVVAHTSGTFATDLAAGKWLVIFDSSAYVASALAFTPTGGVAATNVQAAIAEVDSEAPKKAQNLADVASVVTARSNLSVPSKAEIQNQTYVYFADTGTADAMVATPIPAWTAYATGQRVSVKKAAGANATTTPTLNVNALGAKVIFKKGGLAVLVGDLAANGHYDFQYDAAYNGAVGGWELLNPKPTPEIAAEIAARIVVRRKTADESVTSSITLQDDDHLTFPIGANEEWVATLHLMARNGVSTTGMKFNITVPSGATINQSYTAIGSAGAKARTQIEIGVGAVSFTAAEAFGFSASVDIELWVLNGATPGDVKLQWAQETSSATALTIVKGSKLVAHRIA